MFRYIELWFGLLTRCLQSHRSLLLENLALRQQPAVLKRKHPRPRMGAVDRIFWVFARRFWGAWKQSLVLVNPETVVGWHRAGFRLLCIAKILSGSEINGLHTFLSRSICYDWCSCSATSSYGLACLPAACNRIEACSWKISPSGNSWPC